MKLIAKVLMLGVFFFTSISYAEGTKIGVVNVGLLLEKAPQALEASKNLEKEFSPQQEELKSLAIKLDAKQKELQKNQLVMNDSQKQSAQREITMMGREIQRKRNDIQELVNIRRNEALVNLQKLVNQAIKQIGKKQGFDLILYEGIAYTNAKLDITPNVLEHLEQEHKNKRTNFNK